MFERIVRCHFCGDEDSPHMLADCRPDLVKHEIGPDCTWWVSSREEKHNCYAYMDADGKWTDEHTHFHENVDMTKG